MTRRSPWVIAHRGACRAAPENTIAAFRAAHALGADWVELDVRLAFDGSLPVHHDEHYPDGRAVADVAAARRPATVPDLVAALVACRPMGVNIEIKNLPAEAGYDPDATIVGAIGAVLTEHDTVLVSSFDPITLARVRATLPAVATALLTFSLDDPAGVVAAAARAGHTALHPFDASVDAALVQLAHDHGLAVNVWTVDDPERARALAALGVDGICTNVPDLVRAALREEPSHRPPTAEPSHRPPTAEPSHRPPTAEPG
jgi:glycerophosphoryl diester phosphodiesterase